MNDQNLDLMRCQGCYQIDCGGIATGLFRFTEKKIAKVHFFLYLRDKVLSKLILEFIVCISTRRKFYYEPNEHFLDSKR